jgi:hypothetical protein
VIESGVTKVQPSRTNRLGLSVIVRGLSLIVARARFVLLVGGVLLLIAYWPKLRLIADKLIRPQPFNVSVSNQTEYWCPMCPGVVSDWPSKCPVCHMTLVRRVKGEMTPLPDGVIARVQLSPYRIELAGIRTLPMEYRRLEQEIVAAGRVETASRGPSEQLILTATVFEADAALLTASLNAEINCDAYPGETFAGRLAETPALSWGQESRVRIAIDDPRGRLRPGQPAYARFRIPAARLESERLADINRWRDHAALETFASGIGGDALPVFGSLIEGAVALALRNQDVILAVPEDAVIDTGTRKVVFVESMPGMFDAVEVRLGRRCGAYFPVRSGLEPGQQVVTAGSVLLDAQTRLDPSVAASYFGTGPRSKMPGPKAPPSPGTLSPEDRVLAERQKICPVTEAPLGSMGGPVRVVVNGRPVFICCEGCREPLLKSPAKYLSKLANK